MEQADTSHSDLRDRLVLGGRGVDAAVMEWGGSPAVPRFAPLLHHGPWNVAWAGENKDRKAAPIVAYLESARPPHRVLQALMGTRHDAQRSDIEWRRVHVRESVDASRPTMGVRADVWARRARQFLFFEFGSGHLFRWFYEPLDSDYVQLRSDYATHVASPDFATVGSSQVREALLPGVHIDEVDESQRLPAVRGLLLSMAELVEAKSFIDPERDLSRLDRKLRSSPLIEARQRREEILEIHGRDGRVPVVASVSDLKSHNVLIEGSVAAVIDFEWIGLRPFWTDAFDLARRTCPQAFVDGSLDADLHAVFDAAGVAPGVHVREWVRLSVLAVTALKGAKQLKKSTPMRRRMARRSHARELERIWARMQERFFP